jgi:TetR/AcrR family transcriptional regulator, transcriptional repressor for nem operon
LSSVAHTTSDRILDTAERLVQMRGFNGFSYADVAAELDITKASLHYHFRGKAELGKALIERYDERFTAALDAIYAEPTGSLAKLRAYADLYAGVMDDERMCLCGMLAAEYRTLPGDMQHAVVDFFDANEAWLDKVLREGRKRGELAFSGSPREVARAMISALEGALLTSRPYSDPERFRATARQMIKRLANPAPRTARGAPGR